METETEKKNPFVGYGRYLPKKATYNTPMELAAKVDEYFDSCYVGVYDKNLGTVVEKIIKPPTRAGLARFCGFSCVAEMLRYGETPNTGYDDVIKYALLRIEEFLEGQLVTTRYNPHGLEFALKNTCGWEEKSIRENKEEKVKKIVVKFSDEQVAGEIVDTQATAVEEPVQIGAANGEKNNEGVPAGGSLRWDGTD